MNTTELEAIEWLKTLNELVNMKVRGTILVRVRDLTQNEWGRVTALVQRYKLPCKIVTTNYFGWALKIYGHSPIPEEPPEVVLYVRSQQIPSAVQGDAPERADLDWLTQSSRNKELLSWYKLD